MEYRVVFDVASAGYESWTLPSIGLVFVVAGALLVALRKRLPGWGGKHPAASNVFAFCFLGFALVWTGTTFFTTYHAYSSLSTAQNAGQALVVEGVVRNFKPMPVTGHAMERFCVLDKCFQYSDYEITGGFNNTSSHGGPIREGLPVRISYVGNSITTLEIAK